MLRALQGCTVLLALITVVPMLALALTPPTLQVFVLLGAPALVALSALVVALRVGRGVLMLLFGRGGTRRR